MKISHRIVLILALVSVAAWATTSETAHQEVIKIVEQIRKADYEGDRAALKELFDRLAPYADDNQVGSRVCYWRGFALWRRAINGFNENVELKEQEQDLLRAVDEFERSIDKDPEYIESKIGKLSCLGFTGYLHRENKERLEEIIARFSPLLKELMAASPDNPRLVWVAGPVRWRNPENGQSKAIDSYKAALASMRNTKNPNHDPLEPSWGEPELLMSLAWSYANRTEPDLEAGEKAAREALAMVPYWHYVRDILLPQILESKAKAKAETKSESTGNS